ncbi:hypothetical protein MTATph1_CDS0129 [Moorella phage MTATph1]
MERIRIVTGWPDHHGHVAGVSNFVYIVVGDKT